MDEKRRGGRGEVRSDKVRKESVRSGIAHSRGVVGASLRV